jgi:hypothetical protein
MIYIAFFFSKYLIELILFVGTLSTKEDMDIQNILDDYDDEDESGVTRVEESGNDS